MDFTGMHARFMARRQTLLARIEKVIDQGRFVLGPEVAACEQALANFIAPGAPSPLHTITCASGTDALRLSLMALDIGPGHAVVMPAFGFAAAAEAAVLAGATPIFADIDPITFNLDAADVTRRLREWASHPGGSAPRAKPRALIAIDTFGLPADYQALAQVAREFDLYLIEDAAQSMGASHRGRMAGSLADIAVTSFYPTKTLGCMGDGGAVFTSREDWAERLRSLRDHGQIGKYWHAEVGLNSRLDSLQAAVLLEMLPHLAEEVQERSGIVRQYRDGLRAAANHLQCPIEPPGFVSAWSSFTVLCSDRESLREHLHACGIPTACHYPRLLPESPAFSAYAGFAASPAHAGLPVDEHYPQAYRISRQCLSLPMHAGLSLDEREQVIEALGAWCAQDTKAGCA
jgi:UDP-2-acetamido-2-deoxy-ribo-hexuluronate aminotransferase